MGYARLLIVFLFGFAACRPAPTSVKPVVSTPPSPVKAKPAPSTKTKPLAASVGLLPSEEQLSWEIFLRGVLAGRAEVAHGRAGTLNGQTVIKVRSRIKTSGIARAIKRLSDDVTTLIDVKTALPIHVRSHFVVGSKETLVKTAFAPGDLRTDYRNKNQDWRTRTQKVPKHEPTRDPNASLAVLRGWQAPPGTRAHFYTLSGRTLWRHSLTMRDPELIRTRLGKFKSARIDAVSVRYTHLLKLNTKKKPRRYTLWVSEDLRRLPVLLKADTEYGKVTIELVEYD